MNNAFEEYVKQILVHWPEKQREGAMTIIGKYGLSKEAIASRLIGYNNGPWKRTIVYRDATPHNFPTTHQDFLEQTMCDKEPMNFLSLNLLNDIVTGKKTVHDARCFYAETAARFMFQGISSPYVEGLLFPRQIHTADPDVRYF